MADNSGTAWNVPPEYNAVTELLDAHMDAGRADKCAFIDRSGKHTYGELARRVNQFGNVLKRYAVRREERVA